MRRRRIGIFSAGNRRLSMAAERTERNGTAIADELSQTAFSAQLYTHDFDLSRELVLLEGLDAGAVVSFVGRVRSADDGQEISSLQLEHYPGMTERALEQIIAQAKRRWPLLGVRIVHRIGALNGGENIVLVAVAAKHRGEAFAACEFLMDFLKTQVPLWKRESTREGTRWVSSRSADRAAEERWHETAGGAE